ncbi:ATP-binding protein [Dehalobacter restrictus]|uniref:sensor histidine kinase n=1 Tax=Dehalobacter restrictus TaxID=55583 RepID=UPI00338F2B1A
MFKKGIAFKLTTGFVLIVLISMLTLGLIFIQVFRQYELDSREQTMLDRARSISEVVASNLQSNGQMSGIGGFMRFLDTMAEANVWIMDKEGNPLVFTGIGNSMGNVKGNGNGIKGNGMAGMGMGMGAGQNRTFYSGQLPAEAENVIHDVLSGKESISQSFSSVYQEATITVGVPIVDANKQVIGSVLLHTPVTGITDALNKTIYILLASLLIALLIAVGLGIFYSVLFTRPLKAMNSTALEMARGNYDARTGIKRQDEIGQLGNSLDFLASELSGAREKIDKLEQLRRDFVANVSHEFRTPLTVIRGSLEALTDGTIEQPEDVERYYRRMLAETKSLERLVQDLLELSRLQTGKITIHLEPVHIPSLLADVVKSMQTIAAGKEIQIQCDILQDVPPVSSDYDRLRQLFVIFIDNALKYSPKKTVVTVSLQAKDHLKIIIQDQGHGISAEELPYIWDRFYKTDKSRQSGGTGLGLAIAKHLAELLNARLNLESKLGQGTTVTIDFPNFLRSKE